MVNGHDFRLSSDKARETGVRLPVREFLSLSSYSEYYFAFCRPAKYSFGDVASLARPGLVHVVLSHSAFQGLSLVGTVILLSRPGTIGHCYLRCEMWLGHLR